MRERWRVVGLATPVLHKDHARTHIFGQTMSASLAACKRGCLLDYIYGTYMLDFLILEMFFVCKGSRSCAANVGVVREGRLMVPLFVFSTSEVQTVYQCFV